MSDYSIDRTALTRAVPTLAGKGVLIIGDVMVDEYLFGDAERISPEAPVPVVHVTRDEHVVGGAGNVARTVVSLGGCARLISVCGTGQRAELLAALLDRQGVDASLVRLPGRTTTLKTRVLARQQQVVRIDHENCTPLKPAELDQLFAAIDAELPNYEVVILSDYGKGIVSPLFMDMLLQRLANAGGRIKLLIDPKTPNFHLYNGAFILTPNSKETSEGANHSVATDGDIRLAAGAIFAKLGCQHLLTTLGPRGMALFLSPTEAWHIPTVARTVFDVTGAGDTVIGTLGLGLAAGLGLLESCILANYAAGVVVAQVGAAAVSPAELIDTIEELPAPPVAKWA